MDFLISIPWVFIYLASIFWGVSMLWLFIKSIFKKDRFTFRKTFAWASTSPEDATPPKKKFLIAMALPAYLAVVFYTFQEGLYIYINELLSEPTNIENIAFLFSIAFAVYQYAGFLAYDGVPDKQKED
jgi:hypothetical protein